MTDLTIIVPTTGRDELAACLTALAPQTDDLDRVMVMVDVDRAVSAVVETVHSIRTVWDARGTWRVYPPTTGRLGMFGHPQRNRALELLEALEKRPRWVWSIDDDDEPSFEAVAQIRAALAEGGEWFVFRMRGGAGSHFNGIVVPTMGENVRSGNIGTPMIVFPVSAHARYGTGTFDDKGPGYFGDFELANDLKNRLGEPVWRPDIVAEVRPER